MLAVLPALPSRQGMNFRAAMIRYPLWLLLFLFIGTTYLHGQPSQFGPDRRRRPQVDQNKQEDKIDFGHLQGTPLSPSIGRIAWVDTSGHFAVVWLDSSIPLNDRPLGTRDEKLRPQALLRFSNQRTTRAVGVAVERGHVAMNQEVVIPSASALVGFQSLSELKTEDPPNQAPPPQQAPVAESKNTEQPPS